MERKTKYILVGIGVLAVGTGAYIYISRKNRKNPDALQSLLEEGTSTIPSSSSSTTSATSDFPLKKGSSGTLVKSLQNALIKKYGSSILPQYGADGGFGSETIAALVSKGFPTVIDSKTYASILMSLGSNSTSSNTSSVSEQDLSAVFHKAIQNASISSAITALKNIRSVAQYSSVNAIFKQTRIGLVRKTLVTALLDAFYSASQKKLLNEQFYRIGLKYDGSKWSLSGISGIYQDRLVTTKRTKVWDKSGQSIMIPSGTIIGEYLDATNGVTEVETLDGKQLFVNTAHIKYL